VLGVGCSDPYGSGLNGSQNGLGARSEVNAATGFIIYPRVLQPPIAPVIGRRVQVAHSDLDPALNTGAVYIGEAQYVTPDDAAAGNKNNNTSYRLITVSPAGNSFNLSFSAGTVRKKSAIEAWQDLDPSVELQHVDVPGDGRLTVAHKAIALGGGVFRHEYAVHNLSSDRSVGAVEIRLPGGASVQNLGFHDVDSHSGEVFSSVDWTSSVVANGVRFETTPFAQNANANALRWGTTYSFWFETTASPGSFIMELFKPGTPTFVSALCPVLPPVPSFVSYSLVTGVPYDHVNISSVAQPGPTSAGTLVVPLGFGFPFYDQTLTDIQIGGTGFLSVPGGLGSALVNTTIPSSSAPNGIIAGYWDDLLAQPASSITYATLGTTPNRRFVVEYQNMVHLFSQADTESFQISLHEGGNITVSWMATSQGGSGATIGIEDPSGTSGILHAFNQAGSVVPLTSIKFQRDLLGIPSSIVLDLAGNGTAGSTLELNLLVQPSAVFTLMGDSDPGPLFLGNLGTLDLGFSPNFVVLMDGMGLFGAPDPLAVGDSCGVWNLSMPVTTGLPSGFTFHMQAVSLNPNAPNGLFDISNSVTLSVP